jgi:hypothetical protein
VVEINSALSVVINICMYRRGRIYKESLMEKYNNRKSNTYLILPQTHGASTKLSLER